MLTLSQATNETKSLFKWGGIIVGTILVLVFGYKITNSIIQGSKPPPPPTVRFGDLPQIPFPQNGTSQQISYTLDTVTGKLPDFPDRLNVYKILEVKPDLLALQRTEQKVTGLGFTTQPHAVNETDYQWLEQTSPFRKLVVNTLTNNFTLTSTYLTDQTILNPKNPLDGNTAIETAQSFITGLQTFPTDIDTAKTKTNLFAIQNAALIPATSLAASNVIQVNFYQVDVDHLPIFYPETNFSTMQFIIAPGDYQGKVVDASFMHQMKQGDPSTYPIKKSSDAYSDLQNGRAYIAQNDTKSSHVTVKEVNLGYYIGNKEQLFLMPIVVFQGDGFMAYVSAITLDKIQK